MVVKPEQSGKTFVMIKKINEFLAEENDENLITVNIVFCDNSLLLAKQTKERIHTEVYLPDVEEPYVELSSRKDGSAKNNWGDVRCAIEDGCRNVVCCTNGKRADDILEIVKRMNKHNAGAYNFKIWLDEADKFDNYIKKIFIPLLQLHENVDVYMLTATPQPIFQKYKEVRTMALENTTHPSYHGWNDCEVIIKEDEAGTTLGFARQIADEMLANGELVPGAKGYVPADTQKKSHKAMKDMFVTKGVAVFTVNGCGLELALPRDPNAASLEPPTPIKIKKTEELHVHIRHLSAAYNVSQWPCVVTGNICVGRGISIQQPDFMFNFGILSNCTKKTEASQNAGRLKGNFKEWSGYAPPRVYTTEKFNKIATEYETQSREIAKIAFKKVNETGIEEGTALVTNVEVKNTLYKEWQVINREFDRLEDASELLKKYGCNGKTAKSLKKNDTGFILSSTTKRASVLKYDDVKKEMESLAPLSTFDTRTDKNSYGRVFVAYKDINDKESVKYLVRIAVKEGDDDGAAAAGDDDGAAAAGDDAAAIEAYEFERWHKQLYGEPADDEEMPAAAPVRQPRRLRQLRRP